MEREILKKLREKSNMTQQDLAEKLNISTVYVRKLEKGVANPGIETMIKYERYFNKSMKDLFPDIFLINDDKNFIEEVG